MISPLDNNRVEQHISIEFNNLLNFQPETDITVTSEVRDEVDCEPQTINIEASTALTSLKSKLINDPKPEDGMVSQHTIGMRQRSILKRTFHKHFNVRTLIKRLMLL